MNRSIKKWIQILMILFVAGSFPLLGKASEQGLGFSIRPIHPENQLDKNQTYFDLKMEPNQVQELEVMIRNNTDQEIIVEASVNAAITNLNGILDYSWNLENAKEVAKNYNQHTSTEKIDVNQIKYDSSLKMPLPSLITSEKKIKLPAQTELPYKMQVTMPEKSFDGIILGGIRFTQKETTKEETDSDEGVQIKNKFAYSLGIQLRETDELVIPKLKMNQKKIKANSINGHTGVTINLQNPARTLMRDLEVKMTIYKKGSQKKLISSTKKGLKMAPNSNFDYGIDWNNQPLRAGNYTVKALIENHAIDGESSELNKKWEFEENFTITKKEAKKINGQAVDLDEPTISWWLYVVIGLLGVLILLMALIIARNHFDKRKEVQKKQDLNRKKQQLSQKKRLKASSKKSAIKRKE
ncbi:DUF916 and DUF3324 domain-containing protein [Carnobacterium divergens]|uniref:DUF916 and DUF3324 domain-containing protein n=1 Tax=Carnobacterium divergens TaxID=2748 RepID=A0AAW8RB50_CARDV|nr:DUF916 and DUF3324 domain-containing protein [Carnobacterium divergens]MDT1958738.1 DUF916 and DUF3324 domain-containing protein [Carnobacterium divergens]MDT1974618.1 DUF916 and DUF3324 domain-containing protein [Carnobacterium divergens]